MNYPLQLSAAWILLLLLGYFIFLSLLSFWQSRGNSSNAAFYRANRAAPWPLVAFGMIGASLSGVTFISIPGVVGAGSLNQGFSYMQVVLGYLAGYLVIAEVLLPLYYRLRLTSIYSYLQGRFGERSYKTGASLFLLSRTLGAAFRLYLVVLVLDSILHLGGWEIPLWAITSGSVLLIWTYTFRSGLQTIIWTDSLQTGMMLLALGFSLYYLLSGMELGAAESFSALEAANLGQFFFWEDGWSNPNNFFKQFLSGMFITIVMTGLDQDMMQKNLACKDLKSAKKNMYSFSGILLVVNFLFLWMGGLLFLYMEQKGLEFPMRGDKIAYDLIYPQLALTQLPLFMGICFLLGLVAAAYSSADSALTALTTSFSIDILGLSEEDETAKSKQVRQRVHLFFSALLVGVILLFAYINEQSVINQLFKAAGYTYGPLLGLYSFGLFSKRSVKDQYIPFLAIGAPLLSFVINYYSEELFWGYKFGFEILLLNGGLMLLGLLALSRRGEV